MKERIEYIDELRGFAAILVVIGHVFQLFLNHENSPIFNAIFSVQMPLFMAISGFSTLFSKPLYSCSDVFLRIRKRLLALLLPWFVWSLLVFIFKSELSISAYIFYVVNHMESAYWFLFSLWTIDFLFSWISFFSSKITKKIVFQLIFECFFSFCVVVGMYLLGIRVGVSFLGIKYTCFYFAFFILGRIIAIIQIHSNLSQNTTSLFDFLMAMLVATYFLLISKFNIIKMEDTMLNVVIRYTISGSICVFLFYSFKRNKEHKNSFFYKLLRTAGKNSLELYVVQVFALRFIPINDLDLLTFQGYLFCIADIILVFLLCSALIALININPVTKLILFGKRSKPIRITNI